VFGGELTLSTFGDFQASDDPAGKDRAGPLGRRFGMCADKFGVNWLVNITAAISEGS
jgi:predicted 3-demethylubiquinone-9 3-methyltransferase (glyoxalase superfamily)